VGRSRGRRTRSQFGWQPQATQRDASSGGPGCSTRVSTVGFEYGRPDCDECGCTARPHGALAISLKLARVEAGRMRGAMHAAQGPPSMPRRMGGLFVRRVGGQGRATARVESRRPCQPVFAARRRQRTAALCSEAFCIPRALPVRARARRMYVHVPIHVRLRVGGRVADTTRRPGLPMGMQSTTGLGRWGSVGGGAGGSRRPKQAGPYR
jgi:hypothetical protein